MQTPISRQIGSLLPSLLWLAVILFFFVPYLGDGQIDLSSLGLVIILVVFAMGAGTLSSLVSTAVTVDPTSRTVTVSRRLVGLPISTTAVPFRDLANVELQNYRQAAGRASHDAWRVTAATTEGRRFVLNWDGKRDEMATLATRISSMTGAELVDQSTKPVSPFQPVFDTMQGPGEMAPQEQAPSEAPAPEAAPAEAGAPEAPPGGAQPPEMPMPMPTMEPAPSAPPPYSMPAPSFEPAAAPPQPAPSAGSVAELYRMPLTQLEARVAADPMDSNARYALARQYQMRGQLDRAIQTYQEVMRIDTTNAEAQNDLGVALQQRGKRSEAEAAYRRAIALDPFSGTAHLNLALLLRSTKRAAEASQEFYQARQSARGDEMLKLAEAASTGAPVNAQLSPLQ